MPFYFLTFLQANDVFPLQTRTPCRARNVIYHIRVPIEGLRLAASALQFGSRTLQKPCFHGMKV